MKRLLIAFLAALMLVGCGSVGVGNDSETKPNDENTTEPAEAQTQAQTVEAETAPTDEAESFTDLVDEELPDSESEPSLPVVYMTSDISSDGLTAVYEALGANPGGKNRGQNFDGRAGEQLSSYRPDRRACAVA